MKIPLSRVLFPSFLLLILWQVNPAALSAQRPVQPGPGTGQQTQFPVDTIIYHGPDTKDKCINIVFLSEGYRFSELPKFKSDVREVISKFFSYEPFKAYQNYFNVFAVEVPSGQSGTDHPRDAPDCPLSHPYLDVDTYFDCTFDYKNSIITGSWVSYVFGTNTRHAFIAPKKHSRVNSVVSNTVPNADIKVLYVNTPYDGGTTRKGEFCTITAGANHAQSAKLLLHEMGHYLGELSDEYCGGSVRESPNLTQETDPAKVKWKNWLGTGGTGIYPHCSEIHGSLWHHSDKFDLCPMQSIEGYRIYCDPCGDALVERIHDLFGSPIIKYSPPEPMVHIRCPMQAEFPFSIATVKPNPNTLRVRWILNGDTLHDEDDKESIVIDYWDLDSISNILTVEVMDFNKEMFRSDRHYKDKAHTYYQTWQIAKILPILNMAIRQPETPSCCNGEIVFVGGGGTWPYNFQTIGTSYACNNDTCIQLCAGNYTTTVTDAVGCSRTGTFVLTCDGGGGGAAERLAGNNSGSIMQNNDQSYFKVYPNPTNGAFIIESAEVNYHFTISNLLGEIIYSSEINSNTSVVNLSDQPEGGYFIDLKTDQGIIHKKIVVNK